MEPEIINSTAISPAVEDNLTFLKNYFGNGMNFIESRYEILENHIPAGLVYISSVADKEVIQNHVVAPLLQSGKLLRQHPGNILSFIKAQVISVTEAKQAGSMAEIIGNILNGDTVLFIEGVNSALIIGSRKVEKRSVESPENESTVLGSQESFTDDLETNTSLIIKRLPVQNLRFEEFTVGTLTCTKLRLIWLEGVSNPTAINEARIRIQKIDIDRVDGIGVIAELIEDKPMALFPKYRQTERPDVTVKNLTDGRFAVICDNSPFAFIAPCLFWDHFKTTDDYQERPLVSGYLRIIRYVSFFYLQCYPRFIFLT